MFKTLITACALLCALTINAEAHQRHRATGLHPMCGIQFDCAPMMDAKAVAESQRVARGQYIANKMGIGGVASRRTVHVRKARVARSVVHPIVRTATAIVDHAASYVAGIVAPLAAKVAEIQSACGSKVISGVRHTYIAGTRHISLHASGKAVDMAGAPECIYSHLSGWSGGYSTDYARMAHVHISYDADGGREMGIRFVHGGGGHRHRTRYAHRHHRHRYASAR